MFHRVAAMQAGLITFAIAALFTVDLQPSLLLRPTFLSDGGALLIVLLDGIILIYFASGGFLLWKFHTQPRLNGFLFNQEQDPKAVQSTLKHLPKFYDTNSIEFAWLADIEKNAPVILAEIRGFLNEQDGSLCKGFRTAYNNKVLTLGSSWRTLNLVSYGAINSVALPRTLDILGRVPNLFTCNLSRMEPHSRLKSHAGESTCYIRCHLGIVIPATAPTTALHVGGETRSWEVGKVQAFCDGHWHGAVNDSDQTRYVLIFDVMPAKLGWYKKQFCALMVAVSATQYLLPGRLNLDEPLWQPVVLLGYMALSTAGVPLLAGLYLYFRYFCKRRPNWLRHLANEGFGFYF